MHLGNLLLDFQNGPWLLVTSTEIKYSPHLEGKPFSQRIRRKLLALAHPLLHRLMDLTGFPLTCDEKEARVRGGCIVGYLGQYSEWPFLS